MSENPGTSKQDGICQAAPETKVSPQLGLTERLRQLPNDIARGCEIDRRIAEAEAKLRKNGCHQVVFGGL